MKLNVVIEPGEDFGFVAHVPALRGCWSQGATRDEARDNIREAIAGWLEAEQDKVAAVPASAVVESVEV